ncbi:hypothetical protein [Nocardia rhamnosiphila]
MIVGRDAELLRAGATTDEKRRESLLRARRSAVHSGESSRCSRASRAACRRVFGVAVGAVLGPLVGHDGPVGATSPRSRHYQPCHYEVLADVAAADEAVCLLTGRTDRRE